MELYIRQVSAGGKVSYVPYVEPAPKRLQNDEFTPEQMVTMVGTMGICLIESVGRLLPGHTKISREIKKVEQALLSLYANTGQPLDNETVEWAIDCWNETMRRIAEGRSR